MKPLSQDDDDIAALTSQRGTGTNTADIEHQDRETNGTIGGRGNQAGILMTSDTAPERHRSQLRERIADAEI